MPVGLVVKMLTQAVEALFGVRVVAIAFEAFVVVRFALDDRRPIGEKRTRCCRVIFTRGWHASPRRTHNARSRDSGSMEVLGEQEHAAHAVEAVHGKFSVRVVLAAVVAVGFALGDQRPTDGARCC